MINGGNKFKNVSLFLVNVPLKKTTTTKNKHKNPSMLYYLPYCEIFYVVSDPIPYFEKIILESCNNMLQLKSTSELLRSLNF